MCEKISQWKVRIAKRPQWMRYQERVCHGIDNENGYCCRSLPRDKTSKVEKHRGKEWGFRLQVFEEQACIDGHHTEPHTCRSSSNWTCSVSLSDTWVHKDKVTKTLLALIWPENLRLQSVFTSLYMQFGKVCTRSKDHVCSPWPLFVILEWVIYD